MERNPPGQTLGLAPPAKFCNYIGVLDPELSKSGQMSARVEINI
jgi:hypothetical protein